jgi:hypothetical protein
VGRINDGRCSAAQPIQHLEHNIAGRREMTTFETDKQIQDSEVLDEILKDFTILALRDHCIEFFLEASEGKVYSRAPSLALRLPHEDYVIVVKPMITRRQGVMVDDRGVLIECLKRCNDAVQNKFPVKMLKVSVETSARKTMWYRNGKSDGAATALVEMARFFVDDPQSVISRNTDNCCCCGKSLRDEVSRARGVGPECLTKMGVFFRWGCLT